VIGCGTFRSPTQCMNGLKGVLSGKPRSGTEEQVLLEEIALRDPVMPVADSLIGGFIRIEGV